MENTKEVFWKSRVEVLVTYKFFKRVIGNDSCFRVLFKRIDAADVCAISKEKNFFSMLKSLVINMVWLVLGFVTFGICWPQKLRCRILSTGM